MKKILALLLVALPAYGQTGGPITVNSSGAINSPLPAATIASANGWATTTSQLNGYMAESLSAASSSTLTRLGLVSADTIMLNAGSGTYVVNRSLQDSGSKTGDIWEINVSYPASTNPTLNIYDNSTGGALLSTSVGTAIAGTTTLQFVFNGTNWVHYAKGALLTRNLGTGVQAATALATNTAGGLLTQSSTTLPEIYIAARTDGVTGTGTVTNPYDGSTEAKFDALMGASGSLIGTACRIHLGAGVFVTNGSFVNTESQLVAQGEDQTTIRLAPSQAVAGTAKTVLSFYGTTSGVNQKIDGFTVDGNLANQSAAAHIAVNGVYGVGVISHVKAINCGTTDADHTGPESFWVFDANQSTTQNSYSNLIEDCVCIAPSTSQYITYFCISGANLNGEGPATVSARNAVINRCSVVAPSPTTTSTGRAFTFANVDSGVLENCYTDGLEEGYHHDTWANRRIAIHDNVFLRCTAAAVEILGPNSPSNTFTDHFDVYNNLIELVPETTNANTCSAIVLSLLNNGRDFNIYNNKIRLSPLMASTGALNGAVLLQSTTAFQANVDVHDNTIDLPSISGWITINGGVSPGNSYSLRYFGIRDERNHDSNWQNVFGDSWSRSTFNVASAGQYCLWSTFGSLNNMQGRLSVKTRSIVSGTFTLNPSTGTATVSVPTITAYSRITISQNPTAISGTPGYVFQNALTVGTGFTAQSSNAADGSTYSYTVDLGDQANSVSAQVNVPIVLGATSAMTQLSADNPATTGEAACTYYQSFCGTGAGGYGLIEGYINRAAQVTVDLVEDSDQSYWGNFINAPGHTSSAGGTLTTLTFNYANALVTTASIANQGVAWRVGAGTPNSSVVGNVGDFYLNTSGGSATTLYVKESGAGTTTGWVGK